MLLLGAPIALLHSIQHPCLPLFLSLKALQGLSIVLDLQMKAPLHSQALLQHWPTGLLSHPLSAHDLLASALTEYSLPSTLLLANSVSLSHHASSKKPPLTVHLLLGQVWMPPWVPAVPRQLSHCSWFSGVPHGQGVDSASCLQPPRDTSWFWRVCA